MFQVPDYIRSLVPYVPGKPIEETQREFNLKSVIKLASNENPLGPSPKALAAIQQHLHDLHRYPDSGGFHLKHALSSHLGVAKSSLILGNGSNEVIDHIIRTFCVAGDAIAIPEAAFIAYKICAQIHGVQTFESPLDRASMKPSVAELVELVRSEPRIKAVFLANPNNPTGTYLNKEELQTLARDLASIRNGSVLLVLDYAYWEYVTVSDLPDGIEFLKKHSNVIVLRTFSKVYGLAGLRLGYGVASAEIIEHMDKVRQPFNINSLSLAGAVAALNDIEFVTRARQVNQDGRRFWEASLTRMKVPFWPGQGNFILIDTQKGFGLSCTELFHLCLKKGVIFRPVANYGMPYALRISIGTEAENATAVEVLEQVLAGSQSS